MFVVISHAVNPNAPAAEQKCRWQEVVHTDMLSVYGGPDGEIASASSLSCGSQPKTHVSAAALCISEDCMEFLRPQGILRRLNYIGGAYFWPFGGSG